MHYIRGVIEMSKKSSWLRVFAISLCIALVLGCGGSGVSDRNPQVVAETAQNDHDDHNSGSGDDRSGDSHSVASDSVDLSDWCGEHSVPESECTKCHPSLIAGFKESGDWCAGHDLPESHCRLCNPGIVFPQELEHQTAELDLTEDEIGVELNYQANAAFCATNGALIQFASSATAERTGITVQPVRVAKRQSIDEAPAEIVFDKTSTSAVTIAVAALVSEWLVSPGARVSYGQPLAKLQSPDIARLRSDLITSYAKYRVQQKELDRHRELKERNLISEADFEMQSAVTEQARAEYVGVRSILLSAGLHEDDIIEIIEEDNLSNRLTLRSPSDGVVIERTAKVGELLNAGNTFAIVGDPSAMWIEARLTERQMHEVDLGHQLVFSSDGGGINRVGGEIIWISQFLDLHTRTGIVRARILDPNHGLRAGEFGRVQIVKTGSDDVSLVHKDAVQWEGCCNVVFVKEAVDRYRPRKVQLLGRFGPYYQIDGDVRAGQEVVVDGAFLLKTELKKSSIGAGCCGIEATS